MGSVCNFLKHRLDAAEKEIIAVATSESWSVLNLSGATLSPGSYLSICGLAFTFLLIEIVWWQKQTKRDKSRLPSVGEIRL